MVVKKSMIFLWRARGPDLERVKLIGKVDLSDYGPDVHVVVPEAVTVDVVFVFAWSQSDTRDTTWWSIHQL